MFLRIGGGRAPPGGWQDRRVAASDVRTTDTGRVEAFSDGVIAIALTLLVLDLITEHRPGGYVPELLEQWPTYLAYVAAFLTIASIWLSHHDAFSRLDRVDPVVRILNLLLLLGVALVPWPTALFSSALAEPRDDLLGAPGALADQRAAVVVYVVVSLIVAAGWTSMSALIARRPHLVAAAEDVAWFRENARLSAAAGGVAVVAGVVGWFLPLLALIVFLLVPAVFFAVTLRAARRPG